MQDDYDEETRFTRDVEIQDYWRQDIKNQLEFENLFTKINIHRKGRCFFK